MLRTIKQISFSCLTLFGAGVFTPFLGRGESSQLHLNFPPTLQNQTEQIIAAAMASDHAYRRLAELCDTFGHRLSGSDSLEAAIDWCLETMKKDGLQNVHGQPVQVPHWIRGQESVELVSPRNEFLPMLGLGGSVSTPPEGITAPVWVVESIQELRDHPEKAQGKIVLFNVPYTEYRETVIIRVQGAIEAAKAGAVASLIRSVGPFSLQTPHTGVMSYDESVPKIPHAAITLEDSERLHRYQRRGIPVVVCLKMEGRFGPDKTSRNVIAELPGSEFPEQIIVLGGHIDSWDVGQGAQDDGGGCIAAWEAVRLIHHLNLRPKRTLRVVLWTNEENGQRGAKAYAEGHLAELPNHVLAIESDTGMGQVQGFAFTGSTKANELLKTIMPFLASIQATDLNAGAGGADIVPLLVKGGVPIMDLKVDRTQYFWYHHTPADTVDKVNPVHLNQAVAALATMIYSVSECNQVLPR